MPLVKEVRAEQWGDNRWFMPQAFSNRDLGYFSALTNVRTLKIQRMEVYRFVLDIEHYFGHLSPTLRSIKLFYPSCTPLQLSHFLSFFSNLDDIEIIGVNRHIPNPTIPNPELVPFPAPRLQGRLTHHGFDWVETWTYLINLYGGLHFRHLDLCGGVGCVPVLFEACAETLETLTLSAAPHPARE